ncbi:MAG: formyltransferase family protein [Chloroflexi bacterium]|nr:formyltransferase family protein [Chloroflexota bacterium]
MIRVFSIGWFSTARGESSRKLLKSIVGSIQNGQLKARIEFVFCSREKGESDNTDIFLKEVENYRLPLVSYSVKKFAERYEQKVGVTDERLPEWRLEYDRQVINMLARYTPDICMLAGYMLIVGPEMCSRYNMINLHPALPDGPKGTWQEVIWTLMGQRATESGVMMHLVTPELDRGPVITYCRFPVIGKDFDGLWGENSELPVSLIKSEQGENSSLFKAIRRAGFIRETPLIIHTLKAFSEGKIRIASDKRLLDSSNRLIHGYDLTGEIDTAVNKNLI